MSGPSPLFWPSGRPRPAAVASSSSQLWLPASKMTARGPVFSIHSNNTAGQDGGFEGEALMETNKRILLVDDHDLVRFGTAMLLESLDDVHCEITPCRSLEEARTACRENGPFDLVLLDLNLPDAKGLQG